MSRETELKLLLAPEDHACILSAPCLAGQPVVTLHLSNTYFDTENQALNHARVALRIRKKKNTYIQTLKTKGESVGGLSHRGEWEWELPAPELDVEKLAGVWPSSLKGIDASSLKPVFSTDFERKVVDLVWEGAQIELALDHGQVIVGEKTSLISELELELKEGPESALISLADELRQCASLQPGDISKAEQGYRLAGKNCQ